MRIINIGNRKQTFTMKMKVLLASKRIKQLYARIFFEIKMAYNLCITTICIISTAVLLLRVLIKYVIGVHSSAYS